MQSPHSDIVEVEWQFDAPGIEAALAWLERANLPGYTVTPGKTKNLFDTYFDTADWRMYRAGFTCRVRQKGDGAEFTLKTMADARGGVRSRREITEQIEGEPPIDLKTLPGPCGTACALIAGKQELAPLFSLRQLRRTFMLADPEGELGEVAVDETDVVLRDGGTHRLARVEVEVGPGQEARARRFVDILAVTGHLTPATVAKYQAAVLASGTAQVLPENTLGPAGVNAEMSAAQAAYGVMRKHFATFLANEPGTRLGEDIEALHDMRVAARRLRAAMQAFRRWLPPRFERFRAELGWVARSLGDVRDLDVQLERMDEWREGFDDAQAHTLDAIGDLLKARRNSARRRMLVTLDSRRYDRFVDQFALVLRQGPPRSFVAGRTPVLAMAPGVVERRYRSVRKLGDAIVPGAPADDYHALRIEAKKLRYALEFFGPIYGKPALDFAARLTALQDLLGLHQDAEFAITNLHEMASTSRRRLGPPTLLAMGAIAERYRQHAIELRAGFPKLYKGIRGPEWRGLRATMDGRIPPEPEEPMAIFGRGGR